MKYVITTLLVIGALVLLAAPATADWKVGDASKMHFPQLPDPTGWDVDFTTPKFLADDWKCSQTGPVTDIHFWVSHQGDVMPALNGLDVKIFGNIPAGTGALGFSRPGDELWKLDVGTADIKTANARTGDQGWFDPYTGDAILHDHNSFFQINITNIATPFTQQEGRIYWLGISLDTTSPDGWKTADLDAYPAGFTGSHYEDDAVWRDSNGGWHELRYPSIDQKRPGESIDLAFVITPEPSTLAMLLSLGLIGLLAVVRRRRK